MSQQDVQQYLENIGFPADKDQIVSAAQNAGAPEQVISQLQDNLPSGEYSDAQQVTSSETSVHRVLRA